MSLSSKINRSPYDSDADWVYVDDLKEAVKELKRRICYPTKPLNTFENAREIEEVINEILGEELSQ